MNAQKKAAAEDKQPAQAKLSGKQYAEELARLHVELVKDATAPAKAERSRRSRSGSARASSA